MPCVSMRMYLLKGSVTYTKSQSVFHMFCISSQVVESRHHQSSNHQPLSSYE